MLKNLMLRADSYKHSHYLQTPKGMTSMSAYIEARAGGRFEEVVFFGLQAFMKEYLSTPLTMLDVIEARDICAAHGIPFNWSGWARVVMEYGGWLPIEIQALPEGIVVPTGTPLVQVRAVGADWLWLATFIETQLLRAIWYPSTVATLSRTAKKFIYDGLLRSSDDPKGQIPFKLHDFGARGATSSESAALGGMAHLVNFSGTDTLEGIMAARRYYGADMPGLSIPAAEHSTITSWGRDGEKAAYANMLEQFGGEGKIVAVVSDSYDLWNAVGNIWGDQLKPQVLSSGGTLVVRPDSGDPVSTPIKVIEMLGDKFGYSVNSKNYKVLDPHVRVIQGDGMDLKTIRFLVERCTLEGWSVDNIAFGMGGGLLQKVNRDDLRFAMKANEVTINGVATGVSKNPSTDPTKASKHGRQAVYQGVDGAYFSAPENSEVESGVNLLDLVWSHGDLFNEWTFDQVRERAEFVE